MLRTTWIIVCGKMTAISASLTFSITERKVLSGVSNVAYRVMPSILQVVPSCCTTLYNDMLYVAMLGEADYFITSNNTMLLFKE